VYSGYARLSVCVCVSVCLSLATCPHHCTDPDASWGNGTGCPQVVQHCWADLKSVHAFHCYENIVPNAKCQRVLVLALCLVKYSIAHVEHVATLPREMFVAFLTIVGQWPRFCAILFVDFLFAIWRRIWRLIGGFWSSGCLTDKIGVWSRYQLL